MDELKVIENLKKDIKLKIGRSLDAPADFDFLSMQIKLELHEYISPTTLKRFFNYITSDVKPRVSTMSLLARFVGAAGWQDYCNECEDLETMETEGTKETVGPNVAECNAKKIHSSSSGYCDIYKVKRFGRWHALKVLKEEYREDPSYQERLYNEFNNVYLRTHPNLVRSVGYEKIGELGNCIVMENVERENVVDYIKNNELKREQAYSLVKELAVIVDFIHENGIVHNDIRKENVIVVYDGGHVKLMDFAKSTGNFYIKYKEYPDLNSFVELVKEVSECVEGGFANMKRFIKRFEEGKHAQEMMTAVELVEILNVKRNWMPLIFAFSVLFSAVLSSLLTSRLVHDSHYGKHVYLDKQRSIVRHTRDISSTIAIFDTLSKMVEEHAVLVSKNMYRKIDRDIPERKGRFTAYSKHYRALVKNKEVYPVKILDKYLPKNNPEYNLYKYSLMQIVEEAYTKYYNFKVDSLRNAK